jgi:DNA-binding MarR family transcriptional regulator
MATADTRLASELSRSWRELGSILASRRLVAALGGAADSRLTPTKLRALDALAERDGTRVGDLAARLAIDETTATRLVDRLEAMGVATRQRDAEDRRATAVVLTREGQRIVTRMTGKRKEFFDDVLGALDPDERVELVRLTEKATVALRARHEELVAR